MKAIFAYLLIIGLLLLNTSNIYAWYGAGITPGWANAYDGIIGSFISSIETPPAAYTVGVPFSLSFRLQNPSSNVTVGPKPLYLKIFRITHSPLTQNLGDLSAADSVSISENTLYVNNQNGNDAQILYQSIPAGTVTVAPQTSYDAAVPLLISNTGYYQYDLTDLNENQSYIPGHIYAAGYLRVVQAASPGPTATPIPSEAQTTSETTTQSSQASTALTPSTADTNVSLGQGDYARESQDVNIQNEDSTSGGPSVLGQTADMRSCERCNQSMVIVLLYVAIALISVFVFRLRPYIFFVGIQSGLFGGAILSLLLAQWACFVDNKISFLYVLWNACNQSILIVFGSFVVFLIVHRLIWLIPGK
ncbi:hypothetical protein A2973_03295 [Candidatus Gottesmanbacteria bacterium RIFCSPLOWO2_01_FULL_49_10]|uniref:Uncharacterized protein n=1 Tax=Candidatus Gottesmanbacteria bacterium RIFCSPLOWO2_01_FULL_49_10 TaxID=1798396 RepID=A0A1F6B1D7_9BACT|nr:MAG: hypothetical protein A2973_03295 [Candidatus Gottesmanbacteria bacterium RIFCSPLOWO2_01_FULL_49_10]